MMRTPYSKYFDACVGQLMKSLSSDRQETHTEYSVIRGDNNVEEIT